MEATVGSHRKVVGALDGRIRLQRPRGQHRVLEVVARPECEVLVVAERVAGYEPSWLIGCGSELDQADGIALLGNQDVPARSRSRPSARALSSSVHWAPKPGSSGGTERVIVLSTLASARSNARIRAAPS